MNFKFTSTHSHSPRSDDARQASSGIGEMQRVGSNTTPLNHQSHFVQRDKLASFVETEYPIRAPILDIPPEVLVLIFESCVSDSKLPPNNTVPTCVISPLNAPLLLTRVCWLWRRVAFDTPTLWTTIDIRPETVKHLNFPVVIPFWIVHSRQLPLDIIIHDTYGQQPYGTEWRTMHGEAFCGIMRTLHGELHRCRTLTLLHVNPDNTFISQLFYPRVYAPALQELYFHEYTRLNGVTIDAPNLHTMTNSFIFSPDLFLTTFPSSRSLQSLEIHLNPVTGPGFLDFVAELPELRHLCCMVFFFVTPPGTKETTLHNLTSLEIRWIASLYPVTPFIDHLQLPSLRELTLRGSSMASDDEKLTLMTNKSYCQSLVSLRLEAYNLLGCGSVLQWFEALEGLYLLPCIGIPTALSALAIPFEGRFLCPRLREVGLYGLEELSKSLEPLADLISARGFESDLDPEAVADTDRVRRLKVVEVSVDEDVGEDAVEAMKDMGVKVQIIADD